MRNRFIYILIALLTPVLAYGQELTLTLENCKEMALQNDPSVRNAHLDVLAARAQKQELFAGYFPKVTLNSFGFWSKDPMLEVGVYDIIGKNELSDFLNEVLVKAGEQFGFSPTFSMKSLSKPVSSSVFLLYIGLWSMAM